MHCKQVSNDYNKGLAKIDENIVWESIRYLE